VCRLQLEARAHGDPNNEHAMIRTAVQRTSSVSDGPRLLSIYLAENVMHALSISSSRRVRRLVVEIECHSFDA